MGRIYENILGTARVELCGAMPESFLNACALRGLELWQLECVDAYTLNLSVYEKDLPELEAVSQKCMCSLKTIKISGGSQNRSFIKRRLWLLLFLLAAVLMLFVSSLFIWEIDIYGNEKLSDGQILRQLSDCGVKEGCFWPSLSAELVRSRMLTELPQLSWMTVNISGSRAMVLIQERQEKPEIYMETQPADIIASQSGIIRKMSVMNGRRLVEPGQTVTKAQPLVSGTVEGIDGERRYVCSRAEIMADSCHEIRLVYPQKMQEKTELKSSRHRFALKFGKKRINLYLNGRNNIDECDKISTEYKLGIDGLFALPVSIVKEELLLYKKQEKDFDIAGQLCGTQLERLQDRIDGSLEYHSFTSCELEGLVYVNLYAQCYENIALRKELP